MESFFVPSKLFGGHQVTIVTAENKSASATRGWIVATTFFSEEGLPKEYGNFFPILSMEVSVSEKNLDSWKKFLTEDWLDFLASQGPLSAVEYPSWMLETNRETLEFTLDKKELIAKVREKFDSLRLEVAVEHFRGHQKNSAVEKLLETDEIAFAKLYALLRSFGIKRLIESVSAELKLDAEKMKVTNLSVLVTRLKRRGIIRDKK